MVAEPDKPQGTPERPAKAKGRRKATGRGRPEPDNQQAGQVQTDAEESAASRHAPPEPQAEPEAAPAETATTEAEVGAAVSEPEPAPPPAEAKPGPDSAKAATGETPPASTPLPQDDARQPGFGVLPGAALGASRASLEGALRLQQATLELAQSQMLEAWRAGQAGARCRTLPAAFAVQGQLVGRFLEDGSTYLRTVSRLAAETARAAAAPLQRR